MESSSDQTALGQKPCGRLSSRSPFSGHSRDHITILRGLGVASRASVSGNSTASTPKGFTLTEIGKPLVRPVRLEQV